MVGGDTDHGNTKELKDLAKLSETAIEAKKKELEGLKKQAGADTSKYVASLGTWLVKQDNALACVKTLPSSEPDSKTKKGGPFFDEGSYYGGCDISALMEAEPVDDNPKKKVKATYPKPHPELATMAEKIGLKPKLMESMQIFDEEHDTGDRVWHFTLNPSLNFSVKKPSYFPKSKKDLTAYLLKLDDKKKKILKDLSGIGADNKASENDFDKLKIAFDFWPDEYSVYYLGASGATCSFYVGECLEATGLFSGLSKYKSVLELRNSNKFVSIPTDEVQRGDIVSFHFKDGNYHVEIVTSVDKKGGTFCSVGAGRVLGFVGKLFGRAGDGIVKCDTWSDSHREFGNDDGLKFLRKKR